MLRKIQGFDRGEEERKIMVFQLQDMTQDIYMGSSYSF